MIPRTAIKHRLAAWLALTGLVFQLAVAVVHSAAHLDHLIGPIVPAERLLVAGTSHQQAAPPAENPATPGPDGCALDLGLILAGTFVSPAPAVVPVTVAVHVAPPLTVPEPAFVLAFERRHLPPVRAPPVIAIVV
jgi:hypothetical protein